ncbi:MAG TPA: hypothetical protein VK604_20980 [Bryobacteraceae bacterium]|nr:hypothetical protein [Bryobacteraceae bacterium]
MPLWNNDRLLLKLAALVLALMPAVLTVAAEPPDRSPQLLLTSQRLRRLKRDRERQTTRWVNFENRVNAVPDSPERGFELALYYAITGNEIRAKEAVRWALAHGCERRQVALVLDWTRGLISAADRSALAAQVCPSNAGTAAVRDAIFLKIAMGEDTSKIVEDSRKQVGPSLAAGGFQDAHELYAASEYIMAARAAQHLDVREDDSAFFLHLPVEFLLALKPGKLENPDWMTHVAALALVAIDPNLESSQYLQGWAIEDRKMVREGPGVAYELLWADSYLPGIGYQNTSRWIYDAHGRLFARMSWEPDSCFIEISVAGVTEQNCPPGWRDGPATIGQLRLIPMQEHCVELPRVQGNESVVVWKLKPNETVRYEQAKQRKQPQGSSEADAAGMWRVAPNIEGKACTAAPR